MSKTYDIAVLKQIPILTVAEKLRVATIRTGGDTYQQKDPDNSHTPTSLTLFTGTNSFVRFSGKESGGCSRGSVIDFVRHCTGNSDFKDACEFLSKI